MKTVIFIAILTMIPAIVSANKQDAKDVEKAYQLGRQYQKEQDNKEHIAQKLFDNEKQKKIEEEKERIKTNQQQKQ